MAGVSSGTLASIRRRAAGFLSDTCDISRLLATFGKMGESLQEYDNVASSVPCRLVKAGQQSLGLVQVTGAQETLQERYLLAVPHGTSIQPDDRVTHGGVTYDVVTIEAALTDKVFTQAIITRRS